ncbi:MAG: TetR/AcrR family transcriptional regulator [Spirochaetes bacterium]|nr:TetR/AcrR family transcriptional regulator [Spirochaetota bacterium]MBN2769545.1 TetR/AcrR family transcriptional regulator [Spirochaetota bacterium]
MPVKRMIYQTPETRERILAMAQKLFLESGLFEVQMTDVARQTGISRNSLYRYFRDKTDLAFTLMEHRLKELVNNFEQLRDSLQGENYRAKIRDYFLKSWLNPDYKETLLFLAEFDAYFSGVRQVLDQKERLQKTFGVSKDDLLTELVRKGQLEGSVRKDVDAHFLMVTIVNGIRGLHQRLQLREESLLEVQGMESKHMMSHFLDIVIKGIEGDQ